MTSKTKPLNILDDGFLLQLKEPVVFKKRLFKLWNNIPRTLKDLVKESGNTSLSFRVVPKSFNGISWEGSATYVEATLYEFYSWLYHTDQKNPLSEFSPKEVWVYSSYNHMIQTFGEGENIVKAVDWSTFGISGKPEENSAFWVGTEGSYTPCHFDSYGCNLVAQIEGRKKWTLFPPTDSTYMYPSRIPYEESSVFSLVNILQPDLDKHPLFRFSHPHVVTLEPGDVLFVPHKWWHFVQSLDLSISVNTWIKMDNENDTHLEEAVARALMTALISYFEPEGESWVNAQEELVSSDETLNYVTTTLRMIKEADIAIETSRNLGNPAKVFKTVPLGDVQSVTVSTGHENERSFLNRDHLYFVPPLSFSEWNEYAFKVSSLSSAKNIDRKSIINCFAHPAVISVICKLLKDM